MDQQCRLGVPIDILSDISKESFQKINFRSITDEFTQDVDINTIKFLTNIHFAQIIQFYSSIIDSQFIIFQFQALDCNGLVLKESTLAQFNQTMLKDINCSYLQDEVLSLIYPTKFNNQSLLMVVNISNDGIYEKINNQKELLRGEQYWLGLPAGTNKQLIEIQQDEIIINSQSFAIKEGMQIVFVKKNSDNKFDQIQMANPSDCSSRKHAQIKVQNGRVFLHDGFEKQVSKNGVWVLVKHQRFSNQKQYCFKDFRLAIRLKY